MTITYPDGRREGAILLARSADRLRAAIEGDDDVRTFVCVSDTLVSEHCEAVTIEFEWQRLQGEGVPAIADFVCSKELASRLIARLLNPEVDVLEEMLEATPAEAHLVDVRPGWLSVN